MPDHCPACAAHREITAHRDEHTPEWGPKRAAFNYARVITARACPEYRTEEDQ